MVEIVDKEIGTEFLVCPYCTCWNELKKEHYIAKKKKCFHCGEIIDLGDCNEM